MRDFIRAISEFFMILFLVVGCVENIYYFSDVTNTHLDRNAKTYHYRNSHEKDNAYDNNDYVETEPITNDSTTTYSQNGDNFY
jgi:hypothetical protein